MKRTIPLYLKWLVILGMTCPVLPAVAQVVRPHVVLPDEPVRSVIFENCSSCHGIDVYAYHALDKQAWRSLLESLHGGNKRLFVSRRHRNIMLNYLSENFGANSIPFPREYVPPEVSDYFSDADARVFIDQTCTECHEVRVFSRRGTEQQWRDLVFEMRENGAELTDENLERLVEWLARVRGPQAALQ